MNKGTLLLGLLILTSGCDGLAMVQGVIEDAGGLPVYDCVIDLYDADENTVYASHSSVEVSHEFMASFLIAPTANYYYWRVDCESYERSFQSEIYRFGGSRYAENPLDLGTITMRP